MKVEEGKYSLAELVDWFRNRVLIVNPEYQRGGGLWPPAAKSYFIDTILRDFPFPKVYFHEYVDKSTRKPRREIVDGQQRLSTIVEFVDGKFALGRNAREYEGKRFEDLPEAIHEVFWSYTVSVDVIRNADRSEILQMFRRMNAFTLPLNEAEKRHSEFFGEFKDWVNETLDRIGSVLIDWKVLTSRQIVRMADAEFISDLALAVEEGIVSTSPAKLRSLYKRNDTGFEDLQRVDERIMGAFQATLEHLSAIQDTYATKPHVFHSLLCALIHNRFGLPGAEASTGIAPSGEYFADAGRAVESIRRLAAAHEEKDVGEFSEYVRAASEGGNRGPQRAIRVKWLCRALLGEFAQ
ncbi:hypothetical protein CUJ91_17480 [Paraburkholderia graminis]|uniref:DUF262 domain-containing protein n=1 Tax=Paraburkholderia graminis TaxID=60548 RepID=UPI000DEF82D8|nr:DUF262 domain-containing protein [Paraburkholderia graminis]AXF09522.1 hypothetical protein CUJ91_17480 [Paraburkholderia graminis]